MRLKTFEARSTMDAMQLVRADLGDDAVIVTTRTLDDGTVRITAALDDDTAHIKSDDHYSVISRDEEPDYESHVLFGGIRDYDVMAQAAEQDDAHQQSLDAVIQSLWKHGVPGVLKDKLITMLEQQTGFKTAQDSLAAAMERVFRFDPWPKTRYERPLMLVGQPGAGKTTTIAKLATQAIMNGLKPVVITADTVRAGAVEQLAAFMRVLNLDLIKVSTPEQLKQAIADHSKADQILIDSPGLNAFDPQDMKELYAYSRAGDIELIVTMPGGMDADEACDIARAFEVIGAKWILPTRLDMARRLGGILAAADQGNLSFVGAGNSPRVAEGLTMLDATQLARILLPQQAAERRSVA
jgi:flagellar biosynthesis protein FlhF